MSARAKKSDWSEIPPGDFGYWFGKWLMSSFALKFFHKHRKFPTAFKKSSFRFMGRKVTLEMR